MDPVTSHIIYGKTLIDRAKLQVEANLPNSVYSVMAARLALDDPKENLFKSLPLPRRITLLQSYQEVDDKKAQQLTEQAVEEIHFCNSAEKQGILYSGLRRGTHKIDPFLFHESLHLLIRKWALKNNKTDALFQSFLKKVSDGSVQLTKEQIFNTIKIFREAASLNNDSKFLALSQFLKYGIEIFGILDEKMDPENFAQLLGLDYFQTEDIILQIAGLGEFELATPLIAKYINDGNSKQLIELHLDSLRHNKSEDDKRKCLNIIKCLYSQLNLNEQLFLYNSISQSTTYTKEIKSELDKIIYFNPFQLSAAKALLQINRLFML